MSLTQIVTDIQNRLAQVELKAPEARRIEGILLEALDLIPEAKEQKLEKTTGLIEIWSDGSCRGNPGPGGWGAIVRQGGSEQELFGAAPQTTNNIMEMTGAMKALESTPEGSQVRLTTDSQYVINGITKWIKGWKKKGWKKADGNAVLNQEVWKQLDQANSSRKVDWVWVKGHAGHEENERCDELARTAISKVLGL